MIAVSVIIPVRNGAATLASQLNALQRQVTTLQWELIVVDNGSVDGTVEIVSAHLDRFASARLIDGGSRRGAAFAKNVGAQAALGDILLFCDADDEVDERWIDCLADEACHYDFVGGALDRRRLHTGHSDGPRVPVTQRLHRTADDQQFAVGANLGVTRSLFEELGGFDESFVGGNEDADFGLRAAALGSPVHFSPEAVVFYRERESMRESFTQYRRYGRTEPQLYRKHRSTMDRRRPVDGLHFWGRVVRVCGRSLRHPSDRLFAVRLLGRGVGRIEGSVRHCTIFW